MSQRVVTATLCAEHAYPWIIHADACTEHNNPVEVSALWDKDYGLSVLYWVPNRNEV